MSNISPDQIAVFRDRQRDVLKQRLIEQEVCEYWGVIFSERGIQSLTKQDMTGFLSYRQNHRWREISKEDVASDIERLKIALILLTDESQSLNERLNRLEPGVGAESVPFLGKAKLTPILLVTHPKRYGVWNDYSERALRNMGLFPSESETGHLGDRYQAINTVLVKLAKTYNVTLWRLDVLLEQIARLVRP